MSGYITPTSAPQTLAANSTITFTGTYVEEAADTGTIAIDQTPDDLAGAGWSLSGPQNETGSGDATLADMPVGDYTLTWDEVDGHTTPSADTQTLATDGTITFSGTYEETTGPVGDFVTIPSGQFEMGSPDTEPGHQSDEEPQHTVTLTTPFEMQSTEVTNAQYAALAQWALDHDPPLVTATTGSLRDALGAETEELLDLNDSDCEISYSDSVFTVDSGQEDHR